MTVDLIRLKCRSYKQFYMYSALRGEGEESQAQGQERPRAVPALAASSEPLR